MFYITYDTFIDTLHTTIKQFDDTVELSYLFGTTGHGSRFSLAMNIRTGREIGHPTSMYCWDVISVVNHCFPDAGIEVKLYIGEGYATRARKTAAQSERQLPVNVELIEDIPNLEGNLVIAHPDGHWIGAESTDEIEIETDKMPFGPVILDIRGFSKNNNFPRNTVQYLFDTLERGEEPMEIEGKNHYGVVSGWKAYARWMQAHTVPLHNIRHPFLDTIPSLLHERRKYNTEYWSEIAEQHSGKYKQFASKLAERYQAVVDKLDHLVTVDEPTLDDIREVYYAEQRTQPIYKKLDHHITQNR